MLLTKGGALHYNGQMCGVRGLFKKSGEGGVPLLALDDIVLFPGAVITVFALKKPEALAVGEALRKDRLIFVLCGGGKTGTVGRIVQQMHLPDGSFRIMVEGQYRAVAGGRDERGGIVFAAVEPVTEAGKRAVPTALEALVRNVRTVFAQYAELTKKVPAEIQALVERTESPERTCDLIAHVLQVNVELKRELIGITGTEMRLTRLLGIIESENEILGLQEKISGDVKKRIDKLNREFVLREQLKEINRELGDAPGAADEFTELQSRIAAKMPPAEIAERVEKEIGRLKMLQPFSPEAGVLRTYLEWIADLPWSCASTDHAGLDAAEAVLDAGHYGLKKPKERILEFIAVRALMAAHSTTGVVVNATVSDPATAPILCFVGPPGTGKTSLGSSVAAALGRKFVRASLGGLRDEAEIRGHRKTYVGALPGKILQSMRKAGTANPVFLLDEIDKMASDYRGDPAAALLEVLDPEQNRNFTDNYLEMPYDLSSVLFIATANSLHNIPYPLLDRLEVIEIPGYSDSEKLAIAKKFLLPKALIENALAEADIGFSDNAILEIIRERTMESGVRSLERELNRAVRRLARDAVKQGRGQSGGEPVSGYRAFVSEKRLEKLLGAPKFQKDLLYREARVGVANGLAWTETGGTMLAIESLAYPGKGELLITGNIGDVMKESARLALSYLRCVKDRYAIAVENLSALDYHFHIPEGAIPKDGPSAGITLAVSLLSTLTKKPPRARTAMTGELTLTGRVLPIGGLKEKLLAAIRGGMTQVIIPGGNREDWKELDAEIRNALAPCFVQNAEEAFPAVFDLPVAEPAPAEPDNGDGKK
jgi:ATP-dependent Lon protease